MLGHFICVTSTGIVSLETVGIHRGFTPPSARFIRYPWVVRRLRARILSLEKSRSVLRFVISILPRKDLIFFSVKKCLVPSFSSSLCIVILSNKPKSPISQVEDAAFVFQHVMVDFDLWFIFNEMISIVFSFTWHQPVVTSSTCTSTASNKPNGSRSPCSILRQHVWHRYLYRPVNCVWKRMNFKAYSVDRCWLLRMTGRWSVLINWIWNVANKRIRWETRISFTIHRNFSFTCNIHRQVDFRNFTDHPQRSVTSCLSRFLLPWLHSKWNTGSSSNDPSRSDFLTVDVSCPCSSPGTVCCSSPDSVWYLGHSMSRSLVSSRAICHQWAGRSIRQTLRESNTRIQTSSFCTFQRMSLSFTSFGLAVDCWLLWTFDQFINLSRSVDRAWLSASVRLRTSESKLCWCGAGNPPTTFLSSKHRHSTNQISWRSNHCDRSIYHRSQRVSIIVVYHTRELDLGYSLLSDRLLAIAADAHLVAL